MLWILLLNHLLCIYTHSYFFTFNIKRKKFRIYCNDIYMFNFYDVDTRQVFDKVIIRCYTWHQLNICKVIRCYIGNVYPILYYVSNQRRQKGLLKDGRPLVLAFGIHLYISLINYSFPSTFFQEGPYLFLTHTRAYIIHYLYIKSGLPHNDWFLGGVRRVVCSIFSEAERLFLEIRCS